MITGIDCFLEKEVRKVIKTGTSVDVKAVDIAPSECSLPLEGKKIIAQ